MMVNYDHDDVSKIHVRGESGGIRTIRFDYIKSETLKCNIFKGFSWDQGFTQTFEINHKKHEQLESVVGYYEPSSDAILGLQFETNLRISELIRFAKDGTTKFSLAVDGKKIIGFHVSWDEYLNSLGAYFTWTAPTKIEAKGEEGGKEWDDGADHEGVTKIYVRGGCEGIQFIKCDYVKDGQQTYGSVHGVRGRGFTELFEIDHLNKEYLVSVEGYYDVGGLGIIQGIQFKTNIKTSELMGDNKGRKFSLAANGKKIIGFHGYADKYLNSLGAYFIKSSPFTKLEYEGYTSEGITWDDGTFEGVRRVSVYYHSAESIGSTIFRVEFEYVSIEKVEIHGHGFKADELYGEFVVDYPNEFITSVEGTLERDSKRLASLSFKTSKGRTSSRFGITSSDYGKVTNRKFVLESKGCGIVGFHGRSKDYLYALGAYFRVLPPPSYTEKVEAKGGDGGDSWDDGGFDGIRNIYVGHNKTGIAFVKFLYDKDNQVVVGDDHGSNTLLGVDEFELEYPDEYVISVEGSYDVLDGSESKVISMLRFKTNMRTSQLFGLETTSNFILQKECHKIVGFHGKIGKMLHQIGVHVLPITEY